MSKKSVYCCERDNRDVSSTPQGGPRRMLLLSVPDWMRPHDLLSPSLWWEEQAGFCWMKKKKNGFKSGLLGHIVQTSSLERRPQQPLSCGTAKHLTLSSDIAQGLCLILNSAPSVTSSLSSVASHCFPLHVLFSDLLSPLPQCSCLWSVSLPLPPSSDTWSSGLHRGTSYRLIWVSLVHFNSLSPPSMSVGQFQ